MLSATLLSASGLIVAVLTILFSEESTTNSPLRLLSDVILTGDPIATMDS